MDFYRNLMSELKDWKERSNRKPLIIRGARQVGKTTCINSFSKSFDHYVNLNLEFEKYSTWFNENEAVEDIVEIIRLNFSIPKDSKSFLLFIDEIQESPKAIRQLRYFYEKFPELHVIAAGSLFEFAIKDIDSFPVGRTEQLVIHPLDFKEFLMAMDQQHVVTELQKIPISNNAFSILLKWFHVYIIIGGMPEVVKQYKIDQSYANLSRIYENLWQAYKDDVEKYATNSSENRIIRHIINTAAFEKDRIKMEGFGNSTYGSREVGESMRILDMARLLKIIYPVTTIKPPYFHDLKKRPKLLLLDIGLMNYVLRAQKEMVGIKDFSDFYKGKILNQMLLQEVHAQQKYPSEVPAFWVRDKANSSAEIDLIIQHKNYMIPIEFKSGKAGKLKSLQFFMDQVDHPFAIRLLANTFNIENLSTANGKAFKLMNLPYFLAGQLEKYIEWFVHSDQIPG